MQVHKKTIIFVDGAVGVGKTTFIDILHKKRFPKRKILTEPLHRDWTENIVKLLGYEKLLEFLLARKISAINAWKRSRVYGIHDRALIVERSFLGDRLVREGVADMSPDFREKESEALGNVRVMNYLLYDPKDTDNPEQERLLELYKHFDENILERPDTIEGYETLASIVRHDYRTR